MQVQTCVEQLQSRQPDTLADPHFCTHDIQNIINYLSVNWYQTAAASLQLINNIAVAAAIIKWIKWFVLWFNFNSRTSTKTTQFGSSLFQWSAHSIVGLYQILPSSAAFLQIDANIISYQVIYCPYLYLPVVLANVPISNVSCLILLCLNMRQTCIITPQLSVGRLDRGRQTDRQTGRSNNTCRNTCT